MSFEAVAVITNVLMVIWLIGEIVQIFKSRRREGNVRDAGTFSGMWVTIVITVVMGNLLPAWTKNDPAFFGLPIWLIYVGLAMIVAGIFFRFYSIRYLGRYFTVRVSIHENHSLIQTGPYKWLRHPSYTGAWLAFVGVGLVSGTWSELLVWAIFPLIGLLRRIRVEESVLLTHFGDVYGKYRQRTWRLIPWVY